MAHLREPQSTTLHSGLRRFCGSIGLALSCVCLPVRSLACLDVQIHNLPLLSVMCLWMSLCEGGLGQDQAGSSPLLLGSFSEAGGLRQWGAVRSPGGDCHHVLASGRLRWWLWFSVWLGTWKPGLRRPPRWQQRLQPGGGRGPFPPRLGAEG